MAKRKTTTRRTRRRKKTFTFDERVKKAFGALLLFVAIVLLVSFVSYLYTWQNDQDVASLALGEILSNQQQYDNLAGTLGALLSHTFIYRLFGLGSFLIPVFIGVCGLHFLMPKRNLKLYDWASVCLVFCIFSSIVLAFFFYSDTFPYGGEFGRTISTWLMGIIGWIGTLFLVLLLVLLLLIAFFDFTLDPIADALNIKLPKFNFPSFSLPAFKMPSFGGNAKRKNTGSRKKTVTDVLQENSNIIDEEETKGNIIHKYTEVLGDKKEGIDLDTDTKVAPLETIKPDSNGDLEIEVATVDRSEEVEVKDELDLVAVNGAYDPKLDLPNYKKPSIELLEKYGHDALNYNESELRENKNQIIETLRNFGIEITKITAKIGPTITLFEIVPAAGVRISRIRNLEDDIALSLAALGIRIIAPIPGKGTIGIEVPNRTKEIVSLRSLIASDKFQNSKMELPVALGTSISHGDYVADLTKMPHLLMAGATGQGKSVGINTILVSLLYSKHPAELKFVLVDPKKVELSIYNKIERHFLAKLPSEEEAIITDTKKSIHSLNALCIEMDNRYDLLKNAYVRNIKEYNAKFKQRKLNPEKGHRFLPYIVLVVDEFADLIMTAGKEVELPLTRLAQLARAVGIHLIISTQRPTVNIITGTIKANFPVRIAFRVTSKVDSKTIIDKGGADQLIGRGDMLLLSGAETIRLQCALVDTPEVEAITDCIGEQMGYASAFELPEFSDDGEGGQLSLKMMEKDPMFEDAARMVVSSQSGSTSMLQRKMKLGYNRAGRLMDQLEAAGIVGPSQGSKAREVLYTDVYALEQFLNDITQ